MRQINKIIIHTSATPYMKNFGVADIDRWHKQQGWKGVGYHFVIDLDGKIEDGRPIEEAGAHTKGQNKDSIGICYIGGLDPSGKPSDTRTPEQKLALVSLINNLRMKYGNIPVYGHYNFDPKKACPCFDAKKEYN